MKRKYLIFHFLILCIYGYAHLCDNVFRQADKLIVKPEIYNIVVKNKTTFKIFLQNNMDRGIAEISLEPESSAFEIDITPKKLSIPKNSQVFFEVTITPKQGIKTGNYPLKFRLVGGGREFKSFTLKSLMEKKEIIYDSDISKLPVIKATTNPPIIDGSFADQCWKNATILSNFSSTKGSEAFYKTWVMITFDKDNLYIGVFCKDEFIEKLSHEDTIEINISPPNQGSGFIVFFSPVGTLTCKKYDAKKQISNLNIEDIKYASIKKENYWSFEMVIPFYLIKKPKENEIWDIRITRIKTSGTKETSFWARDADGYHQEKGMGKILFIP
ncbi:MAG: sugar-binding protein [Candidatus Ratteibacteria bacterium]